MGATLAIKGSISYRSFEDLRTLVKGIHPTIDNSLSSCSWTIETLKQVQEGEVVELSTKAAKALPEKTEKQKKRKKALLLFLTSWKKLRGDLNQMVQAYEAHAQGQIASPQGYLKTIGKVFGLAKGPLGLIALPAAVIAGGIILLKHTSVTVVIKNQGCEPIYPTVSLPVSIPGIELPNQVISDGGQAVAKVPPLRFSIDGTSPGIVRLSALTLKMQFEFGGEGADLLFNGNSLIDKQTAIDLGSRPAHEVVVSCP